MSKLIAVSLFDSKVGAYSNVALARTVGEAMRDFKRAAKQGNAVFCEYPDDYELHLLSIWDNTTGKFESCEKKVLITGRQAFIENEKEELKNG